MSISATSFLYFFAAFLRISVLMSLMPIFGDKIIPGSAKILLSLIFTIVLFPSIAVGTLDSNWQTTIFGITEVITLECFVGFLLGFVSRLFFDAIQFGSSLIGTFMGFSMASTYDPHFESHTQVISQLQLALTMILFLILDGHHILLNAIAESFKGISIGGLVFKDSIIYHIIECTKKTIFLGFQFSAPVCFSVFIINISMSLFSKALPQMNIFSMSFAVTIFAGLIVLYFQFQEYDHFVQFGIDQTMDWMGRLIRSK